MLGVLAPVLYPFLESWLDTLLPLEPVCCDFSSFGSFWRLEIAGKFTAHLWPSILAPIAIWEPGVLALVWLLCPHSCCNFGVCLLCDSECGVPGLVSLRVGGAWLQQEPQATFFSALHTWSMYATQHHCSYFYDLLVLSPS